MTPTARTLARLRAEGFQAQVVEQYNPYAKVRVDLFGVIDVIAIKPMLTLGVQATTMANRAARVDKLRASLGAAAWIAAGNELEVWAWRQKKLKRGGKAMRWEMEITRIAETELTATKGTQ